MATFLDDPNEVGLLSLGLRLMSTPGKFGTALGQSGLGAMGDMQQARQAQAAAKQRAAQEQLLKMQMQQMLAQQADAKRKQVEAQQQDQMRRKFLGGLDPNQGPTMPFNPVSAMVAGFGMDEAQKMAGAQDWGRPEVARTIKGMQGGREVETQFDKFGRPVGGGIEQYRAPININQGDRTTLVDAFKLNPLAAFETNMAPGEQQRIDISRMTAGAASRQAGAAEEANQLQRAQMATLRDLQIAEGQAKNRAAGIQREGGVATMVDSLNVLDKALKHPGRETATGVSGQVDPRNYVAGTDATNFKVLLDQIGGKAFLQAFESLKGGGQITEVEGKKATDAIARLNRAQSDGEFKTALQDFRDVLASAYKRNTGEDYKGNTHKAADGRRISSNAEYEALPSGATFVGPDGKTRRKP